MTTGPTIHPAEERLLDAALAQAFATSRPTAVPRREARSWWVAAMLLLGIGVVAATAWFAAPRQPDEAQQPEPAPFGDEVAGAERAGLEALPADTENVLARLTDPRELPVVVRFAKLRRLRLSAENLRILGIKTRSSHDGWRTPAADLLQPVAQLPHLEVLALPPELVVKPELLAPLAGHPTLREIWFVRDSCTIDERLVAALAKVPHLRALHLQFVRLGDGALRHLATLPLTSLELGWCNGLDATGWRDLLTMRTLQRLSFRDWTWNVLPGQPPQPPGWRPEPADLAQLRELPRLRHLELLHCAVDDAQFAALPHTLTTLTVHGTKLTSDGIGALRRLGALRELDLDSSQRGTTFADLFAPDSQDTAAGFAAALPALSLQKLHYRGALTAAIADAIAVQGELRDLAITSKQPDAGATARLFARLPVQRVAWHAPITSELLEALASRPDLAELELFTGEIDDVAPLAKAPKLARLSLIESSLDNGIAADVLAPLARSPALREVVVRVSVIRGEPRASEAELQRALGDRIRLRLHETEMTVKR